MISAQISIIDLSLAVFLTAVLSIISSYLVIRFFQKRKDEITSNIEFNIEKAKKVENELMQAKLRAEEANRVKGEFISSMSHEFKTPLNAILGFAEMLKSDPGNRDQTLEFTEEINQAGRKLLNLIEDILQISSVDEDKNVLEEKIRADIFFTDLLDRFQYKARTKEVTVQLTGKKHETTFLSDRQMLTTLIGNLLDNAVKFTDKGSVKLSYDLRHTSEDRAEMTIEIQDEGIGMDPGLREKAFDPFWQKEAVRYEGTGLGLTICKKLTGLLGGTIDLEEVPSGGTLVRVVVPVKTIKETYGDINRQLKPGRTGLKKGSKVLVTDDMPGNRILCKVMLERNGLTFLEAEDGKQALEMVDRHKPDLILLDINMPVMDGFEMISILRSRPNEDAFIPVIAITSDEGMAKPDELIKRGFNALILKPFNERHLMDAVRKVISSADTLTPGRNRKMRISSKDVVRSIRTMNPETIGKIYSILRMQDMEAISNIHSVLDLPGDEPDMYLQRLQESGKNYDYLFVTKVLKQLSASQRFSPVV